MGWDSESEIRQAMSDNQAVVDYETNQIADLNEKLQRLECAKNEIREQYDALLEPYSSPLTYIRNLIGNQWKGTTRDEFEKVIYGAIGDSLEKLSTDMSYSAVQIESLINEIKERIVDLNWDIACRQSKINQCECKLYLKNLL